MFEIRCTVGTRHYTLYATAKTKADAERLAATARKFGYADAKVIEAGTNYASGGSLGGLPSGAFVTPGGRVSFSAPVPPRRKLRG